MKIKYIDWNARQDSLILVAQAKNIISDYQAAGYTLTLRQLYYQFVARDLIENSERSYKNLGNIITKARMSGLISWEAIEDRNREYKNFWYDEDELNPIKNLPYYIRFDQWKRQDTYIEVWVEKEALGNVISRACNPFLIPHMSCKGYLSASEAWRAGQRFEKKLEEGKHCLLIHLGDHDPSGIDMTRDNEDRVDLFTQFVTGKVEIQRIALNRDQVEDYNPPPNPTKITDTRASGYVQKFGYTSWELDALEPEVIETLIISTIKPYIDLEKWDDVLNEQNEKRKLLTSLYERWEEIKDMLES